MHDSVDISDCTLAAWLDGVQPAARAQGAGAAERSRRRWSWRLSLALHTLAMAGLLVGVLFEIPLPAILGERGRPTAVAEYSSYIAEPPLELTIAGWDAERPRAAELAAAEIERLAAAAPPPELAQELLDLSAAATPAATAWVQQRVLEELAAANRASPLENQQRLAQLGQQLEQISSAEAVEAINGKLTALLGTGGRATQPAKEPVAGEFDHDTAQLHDVKRIENAAGGFDYVAVLLDAAGRTMETQLTAAEGEQLYKTFEIIKANPLLERVYRGVLMSLLDKMMRPSQAARAEP